MTRRLFACAVLAVCLQGRAPAQNGHHESVEALQKAVDANPSSAKAHEQLGAALVSDIVAGNVRPSADSDVAERAEHHLRRAIELAPFASGPLMELSTLEAVLAERAGDADQRADRYKKAQDLLKQVLGLEPGKAGMYFRLASLERDEFGPAIQQAKARFSGNRGPLPDAGLRHSLQQQYGSLVEDAIQNGQKASEMAAHSPQPLLLMSRLLRERALIRDTAEEYASDMHSADDWQRQFLTAGGHLDGVAPK
jgi:tetratricopeptide (TPR) repeat protein